MTSKYRSGLEERIASFLKVCKEKFSYEPKGLWVRYIKPHAKYKPDFIVSLSKMGKAIKFVKKLLNIILKGSNKNKYSLLFIYIFLGILYNLTLKMNIKIYLY